MLTSCMCAQSRNFKKRSQNNFSPTLSQIYQISRISRSIRFLGATVNTNRWTQMIITGCCFICEFQFPNLAFFSSSSSHGCQSQGGIFGKNHSYLFWSVWNFIFKPNWCESVFSTYWGRLWLRDEGRSNNGWWPTNQPWCTWDPISSSTGQLCPGKDTQHFHEGCLTDFYHR